MGRAEAELPSSNYRVLPDGPLLERVLGKDQVAWRELMRRFRGLVFRCITKVAGKYDAVLSNEDVNEIFGDMCFNLLRDDMRKLRAYDPDARRQARLVAGAARDQHRLRLPAADVAPAAARSARRRARARRRGAVGARRPAREGALGLPERAARRLLASATAASSSSTTARGLLPEEVAAAMGISVKTVYSKKNKLRTKLLALAEHDQPARRTRARPPEPAPRAARYWKMAAP